MLHENKPYPHKWRATHLSKEAFQEGRETKMCKCQDSLWEIFDFPYVSVSTTALDNPPISFSTNGKSLEEQVAEAVKALGKILTGHDPKKVVIEALGILVRCRENYRTPDGWSQRGGLIRQAAVEALGESGLPDVIRYLYMAMLDTGDIEIRDAKNGKFECQIVGGEDIQETTWNYYKKLRLQQSHLQMLE